MKRNQDFLEPLMLKDILKATEAIEFQMLSDPKLGSLLKTLTASKPSGRFLEIGTGTGAATAWMLAGMDTKSKMISVENDYTVMAIAQNLLGHDQRLELQRGDAADFIQSIVKDNYKFDLIFADTWVGKYSYLEETLDSLKIGGMYVIDDMLPQANWPDDHAPKVSRLVETLSNRKDLLMTKLDWATGIIVATKIRPPY